MLSDFMDTIVSRGAEALLPHNLPDIWLDPVFRAATRFLRHASGNSPAEAGENPMDLFEDMDGSLFLAAITEIIQSRYDYPAHFQMETLPEEILSESIACYAMYAALEKIHRQHGIGYPHPDPDTLLEPETIREIEEGNPKLSELLHDTFSMAEEK
ncbi:hypothetical protein LZ24_02971 [Desulfobotulus alkaliphilus]|uniref:Uncharacterized protein n=1 Tax=Desulfobotulus alkaliphilus TaxID=622671 RepID=A0A562R9S5_9BACT|nr:hypothetical protein [Desulfobotulus alkaliphilus]TWI65785.1 hypothetical protein LZ24_02971 [Desulfobotulus alkaliphilus]